VPEFSPRAELVGQGGEGRLRHLDVSLQVGLQGFDSKQGK
jgi:hypothetical protein